MKTQQDYIQDLTEIRTMMERSSKFLTLTGWPGIMAGIYALIGAYMAYRMFYNGATTLPYDTLDMGTNVFSGLFLALAVLVLALGTAIWIPYRKAKQSGEKLWTSSAKRLLYHMAVPLITGGILALILLAQGHYTLIAPLTLIFYGLALLNGSKYTYDEVRYLGLLEISIGLVAAYMVGYGLLFWAIGFGVFHIVYGFYMHLTYEK